MLLIVSCTRGVMDSREIDALAEGLGNGNPPVTAQMKDADEKTRNLFLESLGNSIHNDRDCSACAMYSRIDEADEIHDEIVDGEYRATLVWHRGGVQDGEELLSKIFIQDPDTGAWREVILEPYHSSTEYRYSVTELSFNGDIPGNAGRIIEESGIALPDAELRNVSYSYNYIVSKVDGSVMKLSEVVMMNYITSDYSQADMYVSLIDSLDSSDGMTARAGRVDERLSVMIMLP